MTAAGDLGRSVPPWPPQGQVAPAPYRPPPQPGPDPSLLVARPPGGSAPGRRRWPRVLIGLLLVSLVAVTAALAAEVVGLRDRLAAQRDREAASWRLADERIAAGVAATNGLAERLGALEARVGDQPDLAKVASAVQPSVFTVRTAAGIGSGFVLRHTGSRSTLVTNFHVVEDAWRSPSRQVGVANEGQRLTGTVVRVAEQQDLALVEVAADLPALARATAPPKVGDPVLAIGSPLGLGGSASSGIVSAVRTGALQFSAPVSPGNSGGPVVDRHGSVLGVTTAKLVVNGAEGLSFAIPVETVCATLQVC
ncbi:MAG: trypsin-like peptidase domain-containing protein [Acidimicrobiales bacterium]